MKLITKPIFKCDYCDKKLYKVSAMEKHEGNCIKNPATFSQCHDCVNCSTFKIEYWLDGLPMQANGFNCSAFNKQMYPFKAVRKGLLEKYPETFEGKFLMPSKDCKHYEQIDLMEFLNRQ